jgi:hypothetical protein
MGAVTKVCRKRERLERRGLAFEDGKSLKKGSFVGFLIRRQAPNAR